VSRRLRGSDYPAATKDVWTWRDFDATINAIGIGLTDAGIPPGDVVAICLHNHPTAMTTWAACLRIGVFGAVPAEVARRLLAGEGKPGAHTPAALFGPSLAQACGGAYLDLAAS
jgi:acyl-CoA synthetase (AMP-forming)/AMP-acid ligase II